MITQLRVWKRVLFNICNFYCDARRVILLWAHMRSEIHSCHKLDNPIIDKSTAAVLAITWPDAITVLPNMTLNTVHRSINKQYLETYMQDCGWSTVIPRHSVMWRYQAWLHIVLPHYSNKQYFSTSHSRIEK